MTIPVIEEGTSYVRTRNRNFHCIATRMPKARVSSRPSCELTPFNPGSPKSGVMRGCSLEQVPPARGDVIDSAIRFGQDGVDGNVQTSRL